MRITKKPNGLEEKMIFDYLEENASDDLVARINKGKNEFKDCWSYIREQARAKAQNGCACIEDKVVYGWAIHFFEEDGKVKADAKEIIKPVPEKKETPKVEEKPKKVVKPKSDDIEGQMSIMDFLGGF